MHTLLTELLSGLYADVHAIKKQRRIATFPRCQFRIHCLTWRKISGVDKTKRNNTFYENVGESWPAYNEAQLKRENGWMCSLTDIACWELSTTIGTRPGQCTQMKRTETRR